MTSIDVTAFGFDPGLNHGAIVMATFRFTPETIKTPELLSWETVYSWTKKDDLSLTSYSDEYQVARLSEHLFKQLIGKPVGFWGIERDATTAHWGAGRQDSVLQFFLGYFYGWLQRIGCQVIFYEPSKIRTKLDIRKPKADGTEGKKGSGRTASKRYVWEAIAGAIRNMFPWQDLKDPEGDIMDAFVLSFLSAQAAAILALAKEQVRTSKSKEK